MASVQPQSSILAFKLPTLTALIGRCACDVRSDLGKHMHRPIRKVDRQLAIPGAQHIP